MKKYSGLTDEEVLINRKKYGTNTFTKKESDNFIKLLLETFSDPIIKILLIALGIKTIFLIKDFDWYETIGIVIAILVASLISALSEYGSMKAFNKLTEETSKINIRVKRNNQIKQIQSQDVVVNDMIVLSEGDRIPADGIIIEGIIKVDESMLTGESKEIEKVEKDRLYMQSVVYQGNAIMLVDRVGDNTSYGMLAKELQEDKIDSPLKTRLSKLANQISRIGYIASIMVALSYLAYEIIIINNFNIDKMYLTITNIPLLFKYVLEALTLCVTIIVVSVPDGLFQ